VFYVLDLPAPEYSKKVETNLEMTVKLSVPDMNCGHCKASITNAIAALDPFAGLDIDLNTKTVTVSSAKNDADVVASLQGAGFQSTVLSE
jgi:copper chaperone